MDMRFFAKVPYLTNLSLETIKIHFRQPKVVEITQKVAKKRHFWVKIDVYV